jgi:hypothetical protein
MMVLTPTQTFRRYEKAMHSFFRDVRVHRRKEFFAATSKDVHQFAEPLFTVPMREKAALLDYGARLLVLPSDILWEKSRVRLFDPRTGRMAKEHLQTRMTYVHKTIALKGGNLLFATLEADFHILKRVD